MECVPVTLGPDPADPGEMRTRRKRGKIWYVHPLGRYVVVEIETAGGPVRESFFPNEVTPVRPEAPTARKKKKRK